MKLPDDFVFGTATASYQIEGAVREGGRAPSIWDTFAATPGKVLGGDTGEGACDSYHRYAEDVALLERLGVDAYRFSVAMPRVVPSGSGGANQEGLDYYERLVDALIGAGIEPTLSLYHWDLPQYLEDRGGWLNRDTASRMADYAQVVAARLGDRVSTWTTLNEPYCTAFLGYAGGEHAPGRHVRGDVFRVCHHLNLAHGLMVEAIRAELGPTARCSVTLNPVVARGGAEAVRRIEAVGNEVFYGPMLEGAYSAQLLEDTAGLTDWAFVRDSDFARIHQRLDVLGVNYYTTTRVSMRPGTDPALRGTTDNAWVGCEDIEFHTVPGETTDMGWLVEPEGLTDLLVGLSRRYPDLPLMVTENGAACADAVTTSSDGARAVHDPERISYVRRHLAAVRRARDARATVVGYYLWSLLDNYEWAYGYSKRFGIVHVDYQTFERMPKDSFWYYRDVIASRELPGA